MKLIIAATICMAVMLIAAQVSWAADGDKCAIAAKEITAMEDFMESARMTGASAREAQDGLRWEYTKFQMLQCDGKLLKNHCANHADQIRKNLDFLSDKKLESDARHETLQRISGFYDAFRAMQCDGKTLKEKIESRL